jgi:hypothetical protein
MNYCVGEVASFLGERFSDDEFITKESGRLFRSVKDVGAFFLAFNNRMFVNFTAPFDVKFDSRFGALTDYDATSPEADNKQQSEELNVNHSGVGYGSERQHYEWERVKRDTAVLQPFEVPFQSKTQSLEQKLSSAVGFQVPVIN